MNNVNLKYNINIKYILYTQLNSILNEFTVIIVCACVEFLPQRNNGSTYPAGKANVVDVDISGVKMVIKTMLRTLLTRFVS